MSNKLANLHFRPSTHPTLSGIDSNRRLTNGFQKTLARSWVHPYIRAKRFFHDYNLPVIITAIFLLIVVGATILRISQKSSVAKLLAGVTNAGQDYGTLLSQDKTDKLTKNNDQPNQENPSGSAIQGNSASPGSSTQPSVGTSFRPPFSSVLEYFRQDDVVLECSSLKINKPNCSKRYIFSAGIRTRNGPGVVSYIWRSNVADANESNNFAASNGEALRGLQKSITIDCLSPGSYNLQLAVSSPTPAQSNVLSFTHSCVGI